MWLEQYRFMLLNFPVNIYNNFRRANLRNHLPQFSFDWFVKRSKWSLNFLNYCFMKWRSFFFLLSTIKTYLQFLWVFLIYSSILLSYFYVRKALKSTNYYINSFKRIVLVYRLSEVCLQRVNFFKTIVCNTVRLLSAASDTNVLTDGASASGASCTSSANLTIPADPLLNNGGTANGLIFTLEQLQREFGIHLSADASGSGVGSSIAGSARISGGGCIPQYITIPMLSGLSNANTNPPAAHQTPADLSNRSRKWFTSARVLVRSSLLVLSVSSLRQPVSTTITIHILF